MRSRKLRKVGALFLVTAVASAVGAVTIARAATCSTFTLTAAPAARTDAGTGVAPDSSVDLQAKCLHDAFNNPVPNANLDFHVTPPGGVDTVVGSLTTDANGNATFTLDDTNAALAPGGLDTYGSWAASAVYSVAVHADSTFAVNSGVATGSMTGSVPAGSHGAGQDLSLIASSIVDLNSKPVSNGTVVTFSVTGPAGFSKTLTATSTGVTTSADTATATATLAAADIKKTGSWSFTAKAGGAITPAIAQATTGAVPFSIVSGAVASLKVAVSPIAVTVGPTATYNVQANSAIDSNSNPADGQTVVLQVADPSTAAAPGSPSAALTIASLAAATPIGPGSGANQVFDASAANIPYGNFTAKAVAGTVESLPLTFSVLPGLADAIGGVTLSTATVTAGTSLTIAVNNITANGYAAKNGTSVKLERAFGAGSFAQLGTNQLVANVTKGDDNASVTFQVPGSNNTVAGNYSLRITADGATTTVPYSVVAGNPVADLVVTAGDAAQFAAGAATIGNIPANVSTLDVTITKPNNGGTILRSFPATSPSSDITIAAADLNAGLGTYTLQVNGNDNTNSLLAVGSGSLKVVSAVPDTIEVTISGAQTIPGVYTPLSRVDIGAVATQAGQAVAGRTLDIVVSNPLGQVAYHTTRVSDGLGRVSVSVFSTQILAPGPYSVTVSDFHTDPVVHGDASFLV